MAGKGGGSWKVAYADFVTAMMAFFLVMWICAQDQKVKRAVASYFQDPAAAGPSRGSSANSMGSVFDRSDKGSVPDSKSIKSGAGRSFDNVRPIVCRFRRKRWRQIGNRDPTAKAGSIGRPIAHRRFTDEQVAT